MDETISRTAMPPERTEKRQSVSGVPETQSVSEHAQMSEFQRNSEHSQKPRVFDESFRISDIISRMRGKEVGVTLKDGNEFNGVLLSFDENTNVEIKIGDGIRFIQGEQIAALSFR